MNVEKLIADMQAVKAAHTTLEIADILKMFNIQALKELTMQLNRVASK